MPATELLERPKPRTAETRDAVPETQEDEGDAFLRDAQEAIRAMNEEELGEVEGKMGDLQHVFALNTQELAAKRFEPTTEYISKGPNVKGEKTGALAREIVANKVELSVAKDEQLPSLQNAFRHPENGILPLLREYESTAGSVGKERVQHRLKEVSDDAIQRLEQFPKSLKARQAIEFIKRLVDVGGEKEEEQPTPKKKEREVAAPSLREQTQEELIASVKRVFPDVAAVMKNQLDLMAKTDSPSQRERQLNVLKRRIEKRIGGQDWENVEEKIDLVARLINQEQESQSQQRSTA